ncbi:MAG TPA: NADP-dependent oxidoreductase [Candidatus Saccharimonadia bacterium]|nr:NADP-dependent oxidoreductase [Candidatus Saccharimonadia bacterium]
MKAAQLRDYGAPSMVEINEVEKPSVSEGKVLVEVHAASINPFDAKVRSGAYKQSMQLKLPATLGGDIAGVVEAVGGGVAGFALGDKVYGQAAVVAGNSGAFAEYAVTAAGQIAKMPANVDFEEGASLPLVGLSALQGLTEYMTLAAGSKVFIGGAGGGIGTIAVQIAKHMGADVAATATGEDIEIVKSLGADVVLDYKTGNFAATLSGYDAAFDTSGHDFDKILDILKPGGVAVSMTGAADEAKAASVGVKAYNQHTRTTTDMLDQLRELVEVGAVKPQVGKVFALDYTADAFVAYESHTVKAKIVIKIA